MRRTFLFMSMVAILLGMGIAGCANTTLQTDWKDPGFRGTFRKVIVICLTQEMAVRNTLEDEITAQFTARGATAIPGYTLFPSLKGVTREMIKDKVKETNADGVFLVRPVGKDSVQVINRSANLYDQWGSYQGMPQMVDVYRVESSLYETTGDKIIWQAISDTFEGGPWMNTLKEFARVMGAKLIEHGLI